MSNGNWNYSYSLNKAKKFHKPRLKFLYVLLETKVETRRGEKVGNEKINISEA
jgi:hypothetical protein